jgi:glycosyltransferase involved in cell wall biosynthesis
VVGRSAVSIVLIVHNTAPWLKACFDSIAAQSFRDFELVVVDVASGPRTKLALRRHLRRFHRVERIVETKNVGGAAAANAGIRASTGEYVFVMDSDDVLPPDALSALHAAATNGAFDVTIGRALTIVGQEIQSMRYRADMITWAKALQVSDLRDRPELTMAPYYWGRLYRRRMLVEHDVFMRPGRLFADRYFTCKALKVSNRTGVILDDCYLWRRDRGDDTRSQSITQRSGDGSVLRARVESFEDVETLFQDAADAELLRYVRLSNLMRLFIHTRRLDDALRAELARTALPYAQSFDIDEVSTCEFMLARQKVQWYLLVHERWDALARLQNEPEPAATPTTQGDQLEFDYAALAPGLPDGLCRQFRFKVTDATATIDLSGKLVVRAEFPKGMRVEVLHVIFKGSDPSKDIIVPIEHVDAGESAFAFAVPIPVALRERTSPYVRLGLEARGRYSTQRIVLHP